MPACLSEPVEISICAGDRVGRLIDGVEIVFSAKHPALSMVKLTRDAVLDVEILEQLISNV